MWGWLVALLTGLVGTVLVWYYRSRVSADTRVTDLLTENKAVLTNVNALLSALAARAEAAAKQDEEEAEDVSTVKEASDFLNASGSPGLPTRDSTSRVGATSHVRSAGRLRPSNPIHGFARGPGDHNHPPGYSTWIMDEGRATMARVCTGLPPCWR